MPLNVLLVTKGHAFDYNGFYNIFDSNPELNTTQVEQPAAQVLLEPQNFAKGNYNAVVFYDMWGVYPDANGNFSSPSADYVKAIEGLLDRGVGLVLLNHALVQWPGWPLWREVSGTSFLLREGTVWGEKAPGSGYRGGGGEPQRNAKMFLKVVAPGHPVTAGLGDGFQVEDELYIKTAGFEKNADILPLFRTDYAMKQENFNPPPMAPQAEKDAWKHPQGSDLLIWAKRSRNSPVVASECGDGPAAYANPQFRRFLENAIRWVASDEAKAWAKAKK